MPKKHWIEMIADCADLPGEVMPGIPVLELAGDHRILIERHSGITEYSCDKIGVTVAYGRVVISGSDLELARMTRDQLIITGRIAQITVHRRDG